MLCVRPPGPGEMACAETIASCGVGMTLSIGTVVTSDVFDVKVVVGERGATWVPICSWSLGLSSVRLLLLCGLVMRPRMACRC